MFHTITKWLHTGYTLTSFKEERILDLFELYDVCLVAIEKHNDEIENGSNGGKSGFEHPDSQKQTDLYNELRQ